MKAEELWLKYCRDFAVAPETQYQAWAFGGAPDRLAALVLEGIKTGTASAYDWYLADAEEPIPQKGDYSVLLDSRENAVAVLQTTKTAVVPFNEVSEEHARREGEGDRSLRFWRKVHEEFFRNEFVGTAFPFHEALPVLTEEFKMCYGLYHVESMTDEQAKETCCWKYPEDYAVYDFPSWEECEKKGWVITNREKREDAYFSVTKEDVYFAFFHIMDRGDHIELGIGMKPEYCGQKNGRMLMELALVKCKELHYGKPVQLQVRALNERAIQCYKSVGFQIRGEADPTQCLSGETEYIMRLEP